MSQSPSPPPPPPITAAAPSISTPDLRPLLNLLATLGSILAVLVGLVGAITVHLILVDVVLPQMTPAGNNNLDAVALADVLAFAVFGLLASAAVSRARRKWQ